MDSNSPTPPIHMGVKKKCKPIDLHLFIADAIYRTEYHYSNT